MSVGQPNASCTTERRQDSATDTNLAGARVPLDVENAPEAEMSAAAEQSVFTENLSRIQSAPYSTFSRSTRIWVTAMITVGSIISPMTANIYFPAIVSIAKDLNVTTGLINLTLTTYMVFQGLSPPLLGDFGDMAGRRPAYVLAFTVYLAANIGLALQRNYAVLMVLRCFQSAGSSGTLALGFAVIADLVPRSSRGRYMGIVGAGINVGPTLGPFLGGLLSQYLGWPALFWFLAIFASVWLIPWILFTPETCRHVVGNGSLAPQKWNAPVMHYITGQKSIIGLEPGPRHKLKLPNPLKTLVLSFEKEMGQILLIASAIYLCFILVAATLSTLFKEIYGYSDLQIGLCYLPYGVGCCITSVIQGYILDWNYRRIAKKIGFGMNQRSRDDVSKFPIESARIQPLYPSLLIGGGALIGYGWALQVETSVAVPLVLVFIVGMMVPTSFNVLNTLIIDLFPEAPATAAAANNLVRCLFGAVATAIIDYMLKGMGRGWCFTFLALLMIASIPWLWLIEKRGPKWRAEKAKRQQDQELEPSTANTGNK
mgnify:CR=1 FL=1